MNKKFKLKPIFRAAVISNQFIIKCLPMKKSNYLQFSIIRLLDNSIFDYSITQFSIIRLFDYLIIR